MRVLILFIISAIIVSCSKSTTVSSGTEIGNGFISIAVYDSNRIPIKEALVTILSNDDIPDTILKTATNLEGKINAELPLNQRYAISISTDSLNLFYYDSAKSNNIKTDSVTLSTPSVVTFYADRNLDTNSVIYLSGTGIHKPLSTAIIKDGKQVLLFERVPQVDSIYCIAKTKETTQKVSNSFSTISDDTISIIQGFSVQPFDKPSYAFTTVSSFDSTFAYGGDDKITLISLDDSYTAFQSSKNFQFLPLTFISTSAEKVFWLLNDSGQVGYLEDSISKGMTSMYSLGNGYESIATTTDSALWLFSKNGGIDRHYNSSWKKFLQNTLFTSSEPTHSTSLWALSAGEIHFIKSISVDSIEDIKTAIPNIVDFAVGEDKKCRVLTYDATITVDTTGIIENKLLNNLPFKLIEQNRAGTWLVSENNLYLLYNDKPIPFNFKKENGEIIEAIDSYSASTLWIVTDKRIYRIANE